MKKDIKCFIMGHKLNKEGDCGHNYCDRCDKHEYYNYQSFYRTIPTTLMYIKHLWTTIKHRTFSKCDDCKKPSRIFGKWVGEHKDCLPF